MSSGKEIGDGHLQCQKPDYSIYEAASKSVRNNKHINNMVFHDEFFRDCMRQIQATYKVQQNHWPDQGYGFRIRLIWDYDRLWGTFELGFFKGVFLIDPGPGQDHFQADDDYYHQHPDEETKPQGEDEQEHEFESTSEYREYPLVWRGTSTKIPDTLFYSTLTIGKIRFGLNEIWGHFEAMLGVGLPNDRCEFHGKTPFGPALVSLSIQDIIDDWNNHSIFCEDEAPRSSSPNADRLKDENSKSATTPSPSTTSQELTEEDQKEFLRSVTGIFNITSKAVEGEWHSKSQGLTIRFHVDEQREKVWGHFDVGIVDGYLLLSLPPDGLVHNTLMEFQWRGRESETGSPTKGSGEVTIWEDRTVWGVFRGMIGDIDFKGKRKFMPGACSGHDIGYYRLGWEDYAHGGDSYFY
jgi:hypothetical protein